MAYSVNKASGHSNSNVCYVIRFSLKLIVNKEHCRIFYLSFVNVLFNLSTFFLHDKLYLQIVKYVQKENNALEVIREILVRQFGRNLRKY